MRPEEHDVKMDDMAEECPHRKSIVGGDEVGYVCDLVDKWCLLESGIECDVWEDIQEEWKNEGGVM